MSGVAPRDRGIKTTLLVTDLGFAGYWIATAIGVVSVGDDPWLQRWNWSFFGLDAVAIGLGLTSLLLARRGSAVASRLTLVALALTGAAGLMALNFYVVSADFDLAWWAPNLWLLVFPVIAITRMLCRGDAVPSPGFEPGLRRF